MLLNPAPSLWPLKRAWSPLLDLTPYPTYGVTSTDQATNLVHSWRASLSFGRICQLKTTAASAPHSHIVNHHRSLRDNKAKFSHVPVTPPPQGAIRAKELELWGTHQAPKIRGLCTFPQRLPQSHQPEASGLWLDADEQIPSGHSLCPGSAGAKSSQC